MSTPDSQSPNVLRRFEAIRRVMLSNHHANGLVWITGFSWPAQGSASPADQSRWMRQAFNLLRAQLYVGVAFFDRLNPPAESNPAISSRSLIQISGRRTRLHPGFAALGALITLERTGQDISSRALQP